LIGPTAGGVTAGWNGDLFRDWGGGTDFFPEGFPAVADNTRRMDDVPDPIRERGLRAAALAGDRQAWRALFESAFETVQGYSRWRCGGHPDLTDDVIQEAWLVAASRLRAFDPARSRFAAWVCGIAANVARGLVRKRGRVHTRVRSLVAVPEPIGPDAHPAHDPERVAVALAELSDRHELALRMKYFDQMSVAEMANATGESLKAVESLLTRARQAFRDAYQRSGDTP
jgi:RNA polymerase sigma-70 factor (ECF subfamily)